MKEIVWLVAFYFVLASSPYLFAYDFKELDSNGDMRGDLTEFTALVKKVIPEKFRGFDANEDGTLDKSEFERFLDFDFGQVDANRDGKIVVMELTKFFVAIAPEKLAYYDRNADGFLEEEEVLAAQQEVSMVFPVRPPPIKTFLGRAVGVNKQARTMVVKVRMGGEFFPAGEETVLKEYMLDEKEIRFDISMAVIRGSKQIIREGDNVRVDYEMEGNRYIARAIHRIEKKK